MPRNQCESTALWKSSVGVNPLLKASVLVILLQAKFLVHPHHIDDLAMPCALPRHSTCSYDPIAFLGQFNDVLETPGAILALNQ
jgi:hypothetical protein